MLDSVYKRIEEVEPKVGAYITLTKTQAYERAEELQKDWIMEKISVYLVECQLQ